MNFIVISFFSSLLFGLGLGIAGMTNPANVIGFLDLGGEWNPSLAFVMVGAIAVHSLSYRWITKRQRPLLASSFQIPTRRTIDWKLIVGAILFGAGWGLGGFCPGPAIVSAVSGSASVLVFLASMIAGIYLHNFLARLWR